MVTIKIPDNNNIIQQTITQDFTFSYYQSQLRKANS